MDNHTLVLLLENGPYFMVSLNESLLTNLQGHSALEEEHVARSTHSPTT